MGRELTQETGSRGLTEEGIIHIRGLASRWVRLANGAKAHYVTSGDTGPAVILLHGGIVGSSGTAGWRFMAPFLGANGFRVYCPDQPGYGWADTGPEYYPTLGQLSHIRFVNDFADALGLDTFHISGNSMGCGNTIQYVVNYPERVKSFALIATSNFGDMVDPSKRVDGKDSKYTPNRDYKRVDFDGTEKSMVDLMTGIIYKASAVWPSLATMRTQAALRQKDVQAARTAAGARNAKDSNLTQLLSIKHRWNQISIPGIYLYGLQDVLGPVENAFNQEDVVTNIQFFYPDDCGHQGQTDQPDIFNQVFLEFFRDGKVSWKTAEWAGVSRRRPIKASLVQEPPRGFPKPDLSFYGQFTAEAKAAKTKVAAR